MHKIVLSGYYGFDNAGDEAVLYSIIQALRSEYNEAVEITVLSNKPEDTARDFNVQAVNRWEMKTVFKAIKNADLLISGGGSLLQDVTSNRSVIYYTMVIGIAKMLRKKIVFYAQGVGPLSQSLSQKLVKRAGNKADQIFVRDGGSKALLEKIGVSKTPIEVVVDPVVGMNLSDEQWNEGKTLLDQAGVDFNKKTLGFYLRNWTMESDFCVRFAQMVNRVCGEEYTAVFIPMHYPADVEIAKEVAKHLTCPYTVVDALYSPQQILAMTKHIDYVIAMRLHGLIMAANAGTPFLGISYDPKIGAFSKEIGFGKVLEVNPFDESVCADAIQSDLERLEDLRNELRDKKQMLHALAVKPAVASKKLLD